jgi:septum site-determining protein MinD
VPSRSRDTVSFIPSSFSLPEIYLLPVGGDRAIFTRRKKEDVPARVRKLPSLLKPKKKEKGMEIRPREAKVIGVFSCKGGVGKTTVISNLASGLVDLKRKVLAFDANLGAPNLGLHFGELTPRVTVHDVISSDLPIREAVLEIQGIPMVLGSIAYEDEVRPVDLRELLSPLKRDYELILLDSAPGIGSEVVAALKACTGMIIVTNPYVPTIASTLKTFRAAERYRIPILGVVVNRVAGEPFELSLGEIREALGWPVIGVIPEDKRVRESTAAGIPVVKYRPRSKAARELKKLASFLSERLKSL